MHSLPRLMLVSLIETRIVIIHVFTYINTSSGEAYMNAVVSQFFIPFESN